MRVDDWIKFNCGDHVVERDHHDPDADQFQRHGRHVGRVEAILHGAYVRVQWENGWRSDLPLADVVRIRP